MPVKIKLGARLLESQREAFLPYNTCPSRNHIARYAFT
jgi:hypothetical protein